MPHLAVNTLGNMALPPIPAAANRAANGTQHPQQQTDYQQDGTDYKQDVNS